ncbi:MAG TPA: hypothetical protein VFY31_09830 [Macromonas sp.]|nr:hypothetical protein [Macromonas sp.]
MILSPTLTDVQRRISTDHVPAQITDLPAWTLKECGRAYIDRWVVVNATDPACHSLPAWHRYAEIMAMQSDNPFEWVIEMAMSQTKSGYPEELRCPSHWFEAR